MFEDENENTTAPRLQNNGVEEALHGLRARFIVGGWAVGGVAGGLAWLQAPEEGELYIRVLTALGLTMLAGTAGGFAGVFARTAAAHLSRSSEQGETHTDDAVSGAALGSFCGSFLGVVAVLLLGSPVNMNLGAAWGAGVGGLAGALPGGVSRVLLRMMVMDSRVRRQDKQEKKEARKQ